MSVAVGAASHRPTLHDILANSAPPPWTLAAFMAYLSQNHCLETLEFTMEADRYKAAYADVQQAEGGLPADQWPLDAREYVTALWHRLIETYIMPYGPREVNLPGPVRDRLLACDPLAAVPPPAELDEAATIVFELMNDSVLLPFLDAAQVHAGDDDDLSPAEIHSRQGRSRARIHKDHKDRDATAASPSAASSTGDDSGGWSPKPSFLQLNHHRGRKAEGRGQSPSASSVDGSGAATSTDRSVAGLADDSGSATPPSAGEPLTPPTTPPTSDWSFSTSPTSASGSGSNSNSNSLQRAITVHNAGWKRVGAKLGIGRKNRRAALPVTSATSSTSSPTDADVPMTDAAGRPL